MAEPRTDYFPAKRQAELPDIAAAANRAGNLIAGQAQSVIEAADEHARGICHAAADDAREIRREAADETAAIREILEKITRAFEDELRAVTGAADRLGFAVQDHLGTEADQRMLPGGEELTPDAVEDPTPVEDPEAVAVEEPEPEPEREPEPEPAAMSPEPPAAPEQPTVATNGHHDHTPVEQKQSVAAPANPCPVCTSTGNCTRCGGKGRRRGLKCSRCQGRGSCTVCAGVGYLWDDVSAAAIGRSG